MKKQILNFILTFCIICANITAISVSASENYRNLNPDAVCAIGSSYRSLDTKFSGLYNAFNDSGAAYYQFGSTNIWGAFYNSGTNEVYVVNNPYEVVNFYSPDFVLPTKNAICISVMCVLGDFATAMTEYGYTAEALTEHTGISFKNAGIDEMTGEYMMTADFEGTHIYIFTASENLAYKGDLLYMTANDYNNVSEIVLNSAPLPAPVVPENTTSFGSFVSSWAEVEVEEAYTSSLVPETLVSHDLTQYVTRSEFAAISVALFEKLSGSSIEPSYTPFSDIDGDVNSEAIKKAYSIGITAGTSDTTFEPTLNITREQLATMLCRMFKKLAISEWSLKNDSDYEYVLEITEKFADDALISDYARASVYFMSRYKVVNGVGNNMFAPQSPVDNSGLATREQALLMALRSLNNISIENVSNAFSLT